MEELVVPIAALEHYQYCPRQCALIHVDGMWMDNVHTVRGTFGHRRVDEGADRRERGRRVLRHLPLWSEQLGLAGRADAVEVEVDGSVTPVEYKIGTRHDAAADIQLCAQALCLEEMTGRQVLAGHVWYSASRRRSRVAFNHRLREQTLETIDNIRRLMNASRLPLAVNDARCGACQFLDSCLPDTSARPQRVLRYMREVLPCDT